MPLYVVKPTAKGNLEVHQIYRKSRSKTPQPAPQRRIYETCSECEEFLSGAIVRFEYEGDYGIAHKACAEDLPGFPGVPRALITHSNGGGQLSYLQPTRRTI